MNEYGYFRVAAGVPRVRPSDIRYNTHGITELYRRAAAEGAAVLVTPELVVTAYTCADLLLQSALLDGVGKALAELAEQTRGSRTMLVAGAPLRKGNALFNTAVVMAEGRILGVVPKSYIPNYNEFYEKRWFASPTADDNGKLQLGGEMIPFGTDLLFDKGGSKVGIEICEDLWVPAPPSGRLALAGADVILNLSATDENIGKHAYLRELIRQQSARCRCAYIYASAGIGESSTDLVFSGNAIIAENGRVLAESPRFRPEALYECVDIDVESLRNDRMKFNTFSDNSRSADTSVRTVDAGNGSGAKGLLRHIDPHPFVPADDSRLRERCEEILHIQAWGLMQRLSATGCRKVTIGISGGLDSTLALLVAVKAFNMLHLDRKGIVAITMPGLATSQRTHSNAWKLMELLEVTPVEIPIGKAVDQHFSDIGQNPQSHDATYENSQARERTQILMDMANKTGGMVVGTGDLSELALGWCTYNGDQMSMYGVNASVPKTLVKYLVSHYAATECRPDIAGVLADIVDTPISPELVPAASDTEIAQKTEDLVGPYELHDFFLYHMLRHGFAPRKIYHIACIAFKGVYDRTTVKKWLSTFYRRFFSQQFKRSAMPDGPKVGSICLSPRGDWRMPSDASSALWLSSLDDCDATEDEEDGK